MFGFVSCEDHRASSPAPPGYSRNAALAKAAAPGAGYHLRHPRPGNAIVERHRCARERLQWASAADVPAGQLGERAGAPPQDRKTGADQRVAFGVGQPGSQAEKEEQPGIVAGWPESRRRHQLVEYSVEFSRRRSGDERCGFRREVRPWRAGPWRLWLSTSATRVSRWYGPRHGPERQGTSASRWGLGGRPTSIQHGGFGRF